MIKILVLYDSETGNTRAMAEAVAEGAQLQKGTTVALKMVDEANYTDLLEHDGIAIGSPTCCGQMSWKLKRFFDSSIPAWGKLENKVGCAFSTSGGRGGGSELTCLSLLSAMINFGMLVFGVCDYINQVTAHYGVIAAGYPDEDEKAMCRVLGKKLVEHTKRIKHF